jgi:citrate synthase
MATAEVYSPGLEGVIAGETAISTVEGGLVYRGYTPIFVMAREAGWIAHMIEQLDHNRLIRPRARYTAPAARPVKPLAERG